MNVMAMNHPGAALVDYDVAIVDDHAVAIIHDHAVTSAHHRGRRPHDNVRIVHHDATCRVLDDRRRGPNHGWSTNHDVGNDRVKRRLDHAGRRRLDDRGRRNHGRRGNVRRGLHDPGRRPFHGSHDGPRRDNGRPGYGHRRCGNDGRLRSDWRRREQRLTVSLSVEVEACQTAPGLVALEDQQRLVVVIAPEVTHGVAPLVGDAEVVQLLLGSRGAEVDLDVQILERTAAGLGRIARPSTAERQDLGDVPACRAGRGRVLGAGLLRPEIRDTKQQGCCRQ